MSQPAGTETTTSPFGCTAQRIQVMPIATILAMYQLKCGVDVSSSFGEVSGEREIYLYQCERTGYKFWRPSHIAGNEQFYRELSAAWPNYYRVSRWEHPFARKHLRSCKSLLEIGCGPGHFLKSLEGHGHSALGIELNHEAIANKVTQFPMRQMAIEQLAQEGLRFDAVYAFQVLEHVTDPCSVIRASLDCVSEGGILMFSVPNNDHIGLLNQKDAFDLPPHHIGHFSPDVCHKIADFFELEVVRIHIQRPVFPTPSISMRAQANLTFKLLAFKLGRRAAIAIMLPLYIMLGESGPNMMMVFRKLR